MTIPESQPITWANPGAQDAAARTYASLQSALPKDDWARKGKDVEVFLQGSYKNSTNIRGDSDVDVVVQLHSVFQSDTSQLNPYELAAYKSAYSDATYTWFDFRGDILAALQACYGANFVKPGNKSIKIIPNNGRLPADVVVCLEYRKYKSFKSLYTAQFAEGVTFWAMDESRWVVNFPKPHYDNGVTKNRLTNEAYKKLVRVYKNARTYMVDQGSLSDKVAPSYFLECMMYNVPNNLYSGSFQEMYLNVLAWLADANLASFLCQNQEMQLFGTTPEQWTIPNAQQLMIALLNLWKGWR